jgi:hypothetical protein
MNTSKNTILSKNHNSLYFTNLFTRGDVQHKTNKKRVYFKIFIKANKQ